MSCLLTSLYVCSSTTISSYKTIPSTLDIHWEPENPKPHSLLTSQGLAQNPRGKTIKIWIVIGILLELCFKGMKPSSVVSSVPTATNVLCSSAWELILFFHSIVYNQNSKFPTILNGLHGIDRFLENLRLFIITFIIFMDKHGWRINSIISRCL